MPKIRPRPQALKQIPHFCEVLSSELIEELSALIGKPLSAEEIWDLRLFIHQYQIDKHLVDGRPSWAEVEAALNIIQGSARELADVLKELDADSSGRLVFAGATHNGEGLPEACQCIDRLRQDSGKVAKWAQEALSREKQTPNHKQKGRRHEVALRWLISKLAQVFENATGLKPKRAAWDVTKACSYGQFHKFCYVIIQNIDPGRIGPEGLDKRIKQSIAGLSK